MRDLEDSAPIPQPEPSDTFASTPSHDDSLSASAAAVRDRGYAWVVVAAVFFINCLVAGYVTSFGIISVFVKELLQASASSTGIMLGLLAGCRYLPTPVMGAFMVVAGPRVCVVCGALLVTGGLILAVPASSILYLAVLLGAIVGVSLCMCETPGYLIITDYFHEKRPLANGIRAVANPLGGLLVPPLTAFLLEELGLKCTFLITAGIMLHIAIFGLLLTPFETHKRVMLQKYSRCVRTVMERSDGLKKNRKTLELKFLCNPAFLWYVVLVVCLSPGMLTTFLYLPMYGVTIGLTTYQLSVLVACMSLFDCFARFVIGWITNKKIIKKRTCFIGGIVLGGCGCLVVPFCEHLWSLTAAACVTCLPMTTYWTLITVLLADHFGADAKASTYGLVTMVLGVCDLFFPMIIGIVMDASGGLTLPFLLNGASSLVAALVYGLLPLVARLPGAAITLSEKREEILPPSLVSETLGGPI